jgi:hypothetical protein
MRSYNEILKQNVAGADAMATWLQGQEWTRFCTFTTPYTLTLPSARRLMENFHSRITEKVFDGVAPRFFWVSEKFECKDGYHTHGLLHYDNTALPQGANDMEILTHSFQIVSGAIKQGKRFRVALNKYNGERAAGRYCSKYLLKRYADYDFNC